MELARSLADNMRDCTTSSASRVAMLFVCVSCFAVPAFAEPPIAIRSAKVGYPDARGNSDAPPICKFAAWAPLEIVLETTAAVPGAARLVIETPDADGVMTVLSLPLDLAARQPGAPFIARGYIRPAAGGETTVTVRGDKDALSDPYRIRPLRPRGALTYFVLSLGSKLPRFDLPKPTAGGAEETEATVGPLRGGRVELAAITDVEQLPNHWFGYDAADLVVLSTSDSAFVKHLFGNEKKRTALREWIARGGRIAIALGANAALATQLPGLGELLPVAVNAAAPTRQIEPSKDEKARPATLPLYWAARESSQISSITASLISSKAFTVANFTAKPGGGARAMIPPASRTAVGEAVVAWQAALGIGRVTVIGFDLDRPPFTDFSRQAEFWDWVLRECGWSRASVGSEGKPRQPNAAPRDDEDEVAVALRTHLDTFDGLPVVSFGSVAFLIALYILLIGPLEYYFLKRVFGRLELTWLTFPLIAATVCIAAFLSASAMKGRDIRINKVDVVDVVAEPGNGRIYGSTWFTLFSPKIAEYSIQLAPDKQWTKENGEPLVGWTGSSRAGRAGLLRRSYRYGNDAQELDDVPVQVWSTKSFSANWAGKLDSALPVVESRLVHPPGDPTKAVGTFINRLPFEALFECVAFYAGQAYSIGTIVKGQEVRLVLDHGQPAPQWFQENGQLADLLSRAQVFGGATGAVNRPGGTLPAATAQPAGLPLWAMLYHEASLRNDEGVIPRNASLRRLDQSWRLTPDNRQEVIVMGRAPATAAGPATVLLNDGQSRPASTRQETYVRLYLSVQASGSR